MVEMFPAHEYFVNSRQVTHDLIEGPSPGVAGFCFRGHKTGTARSIVPTLRKNAKSGAPITSRFRRNQRLGHPPLYTDSRVRISV